MRGDEVDEGGFARWGGVVLRWCGDEFDHVGASAVFGGGNPVGFCSMWFGTVGIPSIIVGALVLL